MAQIISSLFPLATFQSHGQSELGWKPGHVVLLSNQEEEEASSMMNQQSLPQCPGPYKLQSITRAC